MIYKDVLIFADENLTNQEIEFLVDSEVAEWAKQGKKMASMTLELDGDEVIIKAVEKSDIKRVRRITGYLSNIDNFNEAKKAECHDRYIHAG